MKKSNLRRNVVLSILFFLPVAFLLMLYPAKHNYTPLDIVNTSVKDLDGFSFEEDEKLQLKDHITVLAFLGKNPMEKAIMASNLKELVYDKFKGFKTFQIIAITVDGTEDEVEALKDEINTYEDLRFWHYVYGSNSEIIGVFNSLDTKTNLNKNLSTDHVFIIDKELNQRGRLDAREKKDIEANKPLTQLFSYDCIEVAELKNVMSEDIRILFTEYRQKRKGKFDSDTRRNKGIKSDNE